MKEARSAWNTWGKICLMLGMSFLILYVISGAFFASSDGMLAIAINGVGWTALGGGFYLYSQFCSSKLERLKREGLCYNAEILRITQNNTGIKMGATISVFADCRFINSERKTCLVRSGSFVIGNFMGLRSRALDGIQNQNWTAKVYVSKGNPRDYYVAIYEHDKIENTKADYD